VVALRAGSATDVGRVRSNNQDSYLSADPLYAVADGMGGAAAGEVASATAIEALNNGFLRADAPSADLLIEAAQVANRAVWDQAEANPEMRGMGTTLVAIALVDGPQLAIVNIGDSRLYVLHDGDLRQITFDHNLVAEMVAEGRITAAEAEFHPRRNIMTRALGVEPEVPIDLFVEDPIPGDRYLLCSDGLPREVSDDLIASLLNRFADPEEAARILVEEARNHGGNDNITVVVVDVVDDQAATDDPTTALAASPLEDKAPENKAPADKAAEDKDKVPARRRRPWSRRPATAGRATRSPLTVRVVAFLLLFLLILAGAAAAIVWYARASYFVGLRGNQIVIYQGRPGGVIGLDPTLNRSTQYTTADVLPSALPALRAGQEESSVGAAQQYVQSLVAAQLAAQAATAPPTTLAAPPTTARASTSTTHAP
jgi:serine/threonine protein phosphatase PrpC